MRIFLSLLFTLFALSAHAEEIGAVDTAFKLLVPNHKVVAEDFDDPEVKGVTCDVSSAKASGLTGALGMVSGRSKASIACRRFGPIEVSAKVKRTPKGAEVFNESRAPFCLKNAYSAHAGSAAQCVAVSSVL